MNHWTEGFYIGFNSKTIFPENRLLLDIGYKYKYWENFCLILTEGGSSNNLVLLMYIITINSSLMFAINPLFIPRSHLSYFNMSINFNLTKNPNIHI